MRDIKKEIFKFLSPIEETAQFFDLKQAVRSGELVKFLKAMITIDCKLKSELRLPQANIIVNCDIKTLMLILYYYIL